MEHRCLSPWKGAVAGGLIVYAWTAFSWMVVPFHAKTIAPFADPAAVVGALAAEKPGILVHAGVPFVFASRSADGPRPVAAAVGLGLLLQMTGAFFWTWILGKIPGLTLKDSALYGLFFGICLGVLGDLPYWVCWRLPLPFVLMNAADAAIAWTLASMALSRCYAAACALPKKA